MSSIVNAGKKVAEIELLDLFPPNDGMITQYYGRIGSGKTYAATADILELLRAGRVVYANWKIHYEGFDERKSWPYLLLSLLFFWKKRFYSFPPENLKYFEFSDAWCKTQGYPSFIDWFASRTDCHIFADEGHVIFDSYQGIKASIEKRATILHTRHFDRSIHVISQRPTAIHVAMRANVNVFYKCEKTLTWPFVRFRRTEYQDMLNENVDENEEKIISVKGYWGRARIFEAYDTKYLRGDVKPSQKVLFEAFDLNYLSRLIGFVKAIIGKGTLPDAPVSIVPVVLPLNKVIPKPLPPVKLMVEHIEVEKKVCVKKVKSMVKLITWQEVK